MDKLIWFVDLYAGHWQTHSGAPSLAIPYGWFSVASFIVLVLTIVVTLCGRAKPRDMIILAGKHIVLLGLPFLWKWGMTWL